MSDLRPLSLDEVMADIHELPSLPAAINALIVALRSESVSLDNLAHDIAKDQALSACVLRVANSPFYGVQHKIASIHDAIVVLGLKAVGSLVTAASLSSYFKPGADSGFDLTRFWRHGIGTAISARALARTARIEAETAFTAGLLHDMGILLLATAYPAHYRRAAAWRNQHDCMISEAEQAVLGFDHAAIGAALAERWRFPPEIVRAVAEHHRPTVSEAPTLADIAHVANALAHALDLDGEPDALVPPVEAGAWRRLNLDEARVRALLKKIELEHASYCVMLADP